MPPTTISFEDVTFLSELVSLQKHIAALFPEAHVRRSFEEGRLHDRPYALVNLVSPTETGHNTYVSFPESDYVVNYYATGVDDSLVATERLSSLGRAGKNRVPVFDYDTDFDNPTPLGYFLRIGEVSVDRIQDLEDDLLWNVNATFTVTGKRSGEKYTGDTLATIQFTEEG